jgi:UDP-2,4-diacetamido-2,4,6-trideoxy-beta-L-altropyranose hydrolase
MRCIALANALRSQGVHVEFVCRELPGAILGVIKKSEFRVHRLREVKPLEAREGDTPHAGWLGVPWETDSDETAAVLAAGQTYDWLIVDHYALDWRWERSSRSVASRIMVVDDIADRKHDCDLLLDHNLHDDGAERYEDLVHPEANLLLGPGYALLKKEFAQAHVDAIPRDGSVRRVLVMFGGGDPSNLTKAAVNAVAAVCDENIRVDVVIGTPNPHRREIEQLCLGKPQYQLHVQVEYVCELMADADLAIGAGGVSTWERCCVGLPALALPIADNQVSLLRSAAAAGLVCQPSMERPTAEELSTHVAALVRNPGLLARMSRLGLQLVDGKGADRVADTLVHQCMPAVPATKGNI